MRGGRARRSDPPEAGAGATLAALALALALTLAPACGTRSGPDAAKARPATAGPGGVGPATVGSGEAGSATAPPEDSRAPRYRIAYNVLHDQKKDDYEIFIMEMDGSGKRNLTSHPAVDWVYTALEDRLYLVSDRDDDRRKFHLYEMKADGSDLRMITKFQVRDSWLGLRGGGEELVVASNKDGSAELYVIDREGRELRRLTNDEEHDNDPIFSPDGSRVVWRSKRSGIDELWVMDLGTGEMRQLTHYPEQDPARQERSYHAGPPQWIPGREAVSFCSKQKGNHSIFKIGIDGTDLEQITFGEYDEGWHSWSPDGRYLAWNGTDAEENYDIYLKDMATGKTSRLTTEPIAEQAPVFVEIRD